MRVDVAFLPQEIEGRDLGRVVAIVIDVLRASTTIATAIASGCEEIIPTASIEEAVEIAKGYGRSDSLLGGERKGTKVEGFDLGNSPLEYTPDKLKGKKLIFTTTNGTGAIKAVKNAGVVLVGSFINLSSAAEKARAGEMDILILCAGEGKKFALEDAICAGMMADRILSQGPAEESDSCVAARKIYEAFEGDLASALASSAHGRYLMSIGFREDIEVAARVDQVSVVPYLCEGQTIRAM